MIAGYSTGKCPKVMLYRHSYKDTGELSDRLSPDGRAEANRLGNSVRKEIGKDAQIMAYGASTGSDGKYIGRGADTATNFLDGTKSSYDVNDIIDERLNITYDKEDITDIKSYLKEKEGVSLFEAGLECRKEKTYDMARNLADVMDEAFQQSGSELIGLFSHSPGVEALAYLVSGGDLELTKGPAKELTGIKANYDESTGIYEITLTYNNNETIVVADAKSIKEKVEDTISDLEGKASEYHSGTEQRKESDSPEKSQGDGAEESGDKGTAEGGESA